MADQRFPRSRRLLAEADFDRVFARRQSARGSGIILYAALHDGDSPRLGLAVSRRAGGAVQRNRWKRRLREAFRTVQAELPRGLDLVVVPAAAETPPLAALQDAFRRLAGDLARRLEKPAKKRT